MASDARKTRAGTRPGRSRTGTQAAQEGILRTRGGRSFAQSLTARRALLVLETPGEGPTLLGPRWLTRRASCELPATLLQVKAQTVGSPGLGEGASPA